MIVNGMNIWDDPAVERAAYARLAESIKQLKKEQEECANAIAQLDRTIDEFDRYMRRVCRFFAKALRKGGVNEHYEAEIPVNTALRRWKLYLKRMGIQTTKPEPEPDPKEFNNYQSMNQNPWK